MGVYERRQPPEHALDVPDLTMVFPLRLRPRYACFHAVLPGPVPAINNHGIVHYQQAIDAL